MMTTLTHYLCIGCPLGCRLEVEDDGDHIVEVRGHNCKRGKDFALLEHTDPRRMLTTTVAIEGGTLPRLPVKSKEPIPKHACLALAHELHHVRIKAPVQVGDVVLANPLNLGIDVIATRSIEAV